MPVQGGGDKARLRIAVVGECGDGKSSLIKAVLCKGTPPEVGKHAGGVTKQSDVYAANIGGMEVELADTPGIGDSTTPPHKVILSLELAIKQGKLDGVLLCSSISKNRVTLGAQLVSQIAAKSFFVGASGAPWEHFILVGTQSDRCDAEEIANFKSNSTGGTLRELNNLCGGAIGKVACVSVKKGNIRELVDAVHALPSDGKLTCKPISAEDMSETIAKVTCTPPIAPKVIYKDRESFGDFLGKVAASPFLAIGQGVFMAGATVAGEPTAGAKACREMWSELWR